jgi:[ribosomal protein S18]-alanine N-acetyltransferase
MQNPTTADRTAQEAKGGKLAGDFGGGSTRYNGSVLFRIRPFQQADFETLWRMDQVCFDPQLAYSQPELAFYMSRPGSFTLVAEGEGSEAGTNGSSAGRILGFIVAEARRKTKTGHVITIDVVPETRRSGVGSALLGAAEEQLLQAGAAIVTLETAVNNTAAIRFYKQKRYFVEKTVPAYYSNGLDALVMRKELLLVAGC